MMEQFSVLNKIPNRYAERVSEIEEALSQVNHICTFTNLDFLITGKEIDNCLGSLKTNKSTGLDCISNETLKCGKTILLPYILQIFKRILQLGIYPDEWKVGYINPIYKSGNKTDASNYREITIMNCLGKLFNTVLNRRLDQYLEDNNIIKEVQIGFQKESRTTDHMFVLPTFIEKYTVQNKSKLFTCFVDLRKAFDSVLHQALFLKLKNNGISGLFYNVIKSMYTDNILRVKLGNKITSEFYSNIGVRQGDTLSPNLFKIFIND